MAQYPGQVPVYNNNALVMIDPNHQAHVPAPYAANNMVVHQNQNVYQPNYYDSKGHQRDYQDQNYGIDYPVYAENPNPYPTHVDDRVSRDIESSKKREGLTCLDCITKLQGDYEQQMFVRKVFGILTCQILFTVVLCAIVLLSPPLEDWLQENIWFYFLCLIITIALMYALVCFRRVARKTPWNYVLLFTYTFFEGLMLATFSSFFDALSVFLCAIMTLVLFATMTVIALLTRRKPKTLYMMMIVTFVLSFIMIFFLIFFTNKYIILIAMFILLIIACVYVIIDIDLITEKHGLSYDDYIIGALFLYMDIVMIFVYLLSIFGSRD